VACQSGSQCLIDCSSTNNCLFTSCDGTELSCANNIIVCNRACP
jgi:hypothetical protein